MSSIQCQSDSFVDRFWESPVCVFVCILLGAKWVVFVAISIAIGGDSIGVLPTEQGFVVESHGRETAVSEATWLFSLYYPLATLTLTPLFFLLLMLTRAWKPAHGESRRVRIAVVVFLLLWAAGWYTALFRDAGQSIVDYANM
jgi:hypothetical protein